MKDTLEVHLKKELDKYKGIAFPVKTGFLGRMFTEYKSIYRLHPNPEDEFSMPKVGPSYRIISEYEHKFRNNPNLFAEEPLIVEKMHPDGYMIANGHHRWAAYYKVGRRLAPIKIVNLTHDEDIREMLNGAVHDKRVTMDLDEVVFCKGDNGAVEKRPGWPYNRIYKEDIREGIPALFHYLSKYGYDIWVYSSKMYSMDYVRNYLKLYHVKINGIVTGGARQNALSKMSRKDFDNLIADKYKFTLHIDNDTVVRINTSTKEFAEFPIDKEKGNWPEQIMAIVGGFDEDRGAT